MALTPSDISNDYIIKVLSGSITRGDRVITKTTGTPSDGSKIITFTDVFNSGMDSEILRISDGVTTIDYRCADNGGETATHPEEVGTGGDRSAADVTSEFTSKINSSALDITAVDNGGTSTNASFTLTPGAGKTITITEDPGSSPRNGIFGASNDFASITDSGGGVSTTEHLAAPFRFLSQGPFNIRGQSSTNHYKVFLGEEKT